MQKLIDIISDTHWDFWVPITDPEYAQIAKFKKLFGKIIPKDHSDTLLIAGDVGHYNQQNLLAFQLLKEYYKNILWVFGNHDLYLVSKSQALLYYNDSFKRLNEMIKLSETVEGVRYLGGNVVNIDGVNIGGTGMWYDYSYGILNHACTIQYLDDLWQDRMRDSELIKVDTIDSMINNIEFSKEQYSIIEKIYKECDIVMSHIGPDWEKVPAHYKEPFTSFYYFNGSRLLDEMNYSQIWLYGHTHDSYDYVTKTSGARLLCNPLGYPPVRNWDVLEISHKIRTISINK